MKAFIPALLLTVAFTSMGSTARAQHYSLQHFDDLAFSASADARALRWEIYNDFAASRDRDHLLDDVQNLISDLHNLQRSIYQGRSPRVLDRDLDSAMEELANLKEHLLGCDFALQKPAQFQGNANGYSFAPETRHGGRVHVDHAIQMLAGIDRKLNELHHELSVVLTSKAGPQLPPVQALPYPQPQVPSGPVLLPKYPGTWNTLKQPVGNLKVKLDVKK
ncbi:hypothetical protein SH661x_000287 [Planctomicrobium sp. SH661]|uniref:hypothetical protein n=1 Tax=Planctomicrobium sp. SH661 TaxID=3448124 RepID=UPI003F5B8210